MSCSSFNLLLEVNWEYILIFWLKFASQTQLPNWRKLQNTGSDSVNRPACVLKVCSSFYIVNYLIQDFVMTTFIILTARFVTKCQCSFFHLNISWLVNFQAVKCLSRNFWMGNSLPTKSPLGNCPPPQFCMLNKHASHLWTSVLVLVYINP